MDINEALLIRASMHDIRQAIIIVAAMATGQYTLGTCPLKDDHWRGSLLLFGEGKHSWKCEFCGKEEFH